MAKETTLARLGFEISNGNPDIKVFGTVEIQEWEHLTKYVDKAYIIETYLKRFLEGNEFTITWGTLDKEESNG